MQIKVVFWFDRARSEFVDFHCEYLKHFQIFQTILSDDHSNLCFHNQQCSLLRSYPHWHARTVCLPVLRNLSFIQFLAVAISPLQTSHSASFYSTCFKVLRWSNCMSLVIGFITDLFPALVRRQAQPSVCR